MKRGNVWKEERKKDKLCDRKKEERRRKTVHLTLNVPKRGKNIDNLSYIIWEGK
jgi:hypothetical protein